MPKTKKRVRNISRTRNRNRNRNRTKTRNKTRTRSRNARRLRNRTNSYIEKTLRAHRFTKSPRGRDGFAHDGPFVRTNNDLEEYLNEQIEEMNKYSPDPYREEQEQKLLSKYNNFDEYMNAALKEMSKNKKKRKSRRRHKNKKK